MKKVFSLVFLWPAIGAASGIVNLEISPRFTYKDVTSFCDAISSHSRIFFSGYVEGGRALSGQFRGNTMPYAYIIDLSPAELATVRVVPDATGKLWLKGMELNTRLSNWLFFNSGRGEQCYPPQPLASIGPAPFYLEFDLESLKQGIELSSTADHGFAGRTANGLAYEVTLQLVQRQRSKQK